MEWFKIGLCDEVSRKLRAVCHQREISDSELLTEFIVSEYDCCFGGINEEV